MDNAMIERVAGALFKHEAGPMPFQAVARLPTVKDVWFKRARAAIEAMREPTKEMCFAATEKAYFGNGNRDLDMDEAHIAFDAMIDAALEVEP